MKIEDKSTTYKLNFTKQSLGGKTILIAKGV